MNATAHRSLRPSRAVLIALVALWLALAAPVTAHAELEATFPQQNQALETPPSEVAARFSEAILDRSSIEVFGPDGASIAEGGLDPANDSRLLVAMPTGLPPGEYRVEWQIFADDGHLSNGTFTFTVLDVATPSPSPTPTATTSASPSPTASASPTLAPTDAPIVTPPPAPPTPASASDVAIPIVAAIAFLAILGAVLLRNRRARAG